MSIDDGTRTSPQAVDLDISGMTCSSCAMRIEKKLNRLPGVEATVNYATERAHVECDPELDPAELVRTVEATGYEARVLPAVGTVHDDRTADHPQHTVAATTDTITGPPMTLVWPSSASVC